MRLHLLDSQVDRLEGEVVAAPFFVDQRPPSGPAALLDWRLNGRLTELLVQGKLSGSAGEHLLVRSNGKIAANWILFFGGGRRQGLGEAGCRDLLHHFLSTCRRAGFSRIALGLGLPAGLSNSGLQAMVREAVEALAPENLECQVSISEETARCV